MPEPTRTPRPAGFSPTSRADYGAVPHSRFAPARPSLAEEAQRDQATQPATNGGGFRLGEDAARAVSGGAYLMPTPTGRVINQFGGTQYRAPGMTGNLPASNTGVDIAAALGDPVVAPVSGTVVAVYPSRFDDTKGQRDVNENSGYGGQVVIRGDDGSEHRLNHAMFGSIRVKVGERIEQGQQTHQVGATGNTTDGKGNPFPHVDWEAKDEQGRSFDPTTRTNPGGSTVATTPTKSNKTTAAEKRLEKALAAFGELDDAKKRATLKTDPNLLTDEQKLIDEEWRTGVAMVPKFDSTGTKITGYDQKPSELQKRYDAAEKEVADAERALADSLDADTKVQDAAAAAGGKAGGPGSSTERYLVNADGTLRYDAQGNPLENPNYRAPVSAGDKPDDPSLIAQRNASAESSRASVAVSLKQLEKLEFDLEVARKKEERIGLAAQAIDAANALPDGPDKTRALREATRGVLAISDPEAFDRSVREEAQAELNRQREEREVQEFQALQTQREIENTRAAEAAATREREGIATGTRALLDSETRRATSAASARQQHFQSGIGSLKNMPEFQKLSAPLTPEMAAQAVGMDPSSAKFRTIWGNAQAFMNGQAPQPTPPQQTAAPIVTQSSTPPVAAIARGAMGPQAADLSEIGGSGWGQQYDPSTGQAQGDPYDIPEEGEQAAPTGPAPAPNAIQKLIRSLGTATPSLTT